MTIEVQERPLDEQVLEGAEKILSRSPAASLFVEWNPACLTAAGYDPVELPARIATLGFSEIRVLDDHAQRVRDLDEVLAEVRSREQPPFWYANLWATKRQRNASEARGGQQRLLRPTAGPLRD